MHLIVGARRGAGAPELRRCGAAVPCCWRKGEVPACGGTGSLQARPLLLPKRGKALGGSPPAGAASGAAACVLS